MCIGPGRVLMFDSLKSLLLVNQSQEIMLQKLEFPFIFTCKVLLQ